MEEEESNIEDMTDGTDSDYEIDLEDMNSILDELSRGLSDDDLLEDEDIAVDAVSEEVDDEIDQETGDDMIEEESAADISDHTFLQDTTVQEEMVEKTAEDESIPGDVVIEENVSDTSLEELQDDDILRDDMTYEELEELLNKQAQIKADSKKNKKQEDTSLKKKTHEITKSKPLSEETTKQATEAEKDLKEVLEDIHQPEPLMEQLEETNAETENIVEQEDKGEDIMDENIDLDLIDALIADDETEQENVETKTEVETKIEAEAETKNTRNRTSEISENCTIITKGTVINGSISSDGSLEIMGDVTGDIECLGKLSISGRVVGNSMASEIYVNADRLDGNVSSEGSVKIGLGTVLVGDVTACSGVIAGAVKGEIDVNGPVVIDSTAIIKGNIKAKSIQVNNGAVVEGFCSLSYASVDVDNIFGTETKNTKSK